MFNDVLCQSKLQFVAMAIRQIVVMLEMHIWLPLDLQRE